MNMDFCGKLILLRGDCQAYFERVHEVVNLPLHPLFVVRHHLAQLCGVRVNVASVALAGGSESKQGGAATLGNSRLEGDLRVF
jgi:hypothetical protein